MFGSVQIQTITYRQVQLTVCVMLGSITFL